MTDELFKYEEAQLLEGPVVDTEDVDNSEEDEDEVEIMRIPRSGRRRLTPIERLR